MRKLIGATVSVLVAAGAMACSASAPRILVVRVSSGPVAFDEPLDLTVAGADPAAPVRITVTATDAGGTRWGAQADYRPSAYGDVDVRTSPATDGSYRGAHETGLLWSLAADPNHPQFALGDDSTLSVEFTATQTGATVGSARQRRWFRAPGARAAGLDRSRVGFVGTMYSPPLGSTPASAVMVLGGSEGGLPVSVPAALASRGHPTLAVAYFGVPGVPRTLANIPLEYFATALRWLARQPGVDPRRIVVVGSSRGSEAALMLGVDYPDLVQSVVGLSPSAVANPGPSSRGVAWTWHGRPVPTVSPDELGEPVPRDGRGIIPVERIRGPVLLVCGDQDLLWPSCSFSQAMDRRLQGHPHTLVREPGAGHLVDFVVPNLPEASNQVVSAGQELTVGGTVQDDALGRLDAWPQLLAFLQHR